MREKDRPQVYSNQKSPKKKYSVTKENLIMLY